MADTPGTSPPASPEDADDIDRPRLTPQGGSTEDGQDETDPRGDVKKGQGDKAEG